MGDSQIIDGFSSQDGGAINIWNSDAVELVDVTISENRADIYGGGVYVLNTTVTFRNAVIVVSENRSRRDVSVDGSEVIYRGAMR